MLPLLQPDLTRFQHSADPVIQAFLTRLDAIQSVHGISDRAAHQVILTALNEHFQQRQ